MIGLLFLLGASLNDGLAAARAGEYEAGRRHFAAFVSERPNDAGVAQATLWLGRLEQDPGTARELYLRVVARHGASPYADSALFEAASIDYAFGLYQQATTKLKQLLSLYPATPLLAETNYWLGVCYMILEDKSTAAVHFQKARSRGAGSIWSLLAAKELEGIGAETNGTTAAEGGYAVQVGSFTDSSRAEKLLSDYQAGGRSGEIKQATVAGRIYYRLWLGPFATQQEASTYAESLKSQGKAAMVVKR
ncbi:Cell division coordinator CpoB [subsurface metagenome]